jgi:two-component system invasion response regulator UvrY
LMTGETGTGESTSLPLRVLVVDDFDMVAKGIARVISGEPDFQLTGVAGDVASALEHVERDSPDVVLMDYQLPDGDGAMATEMILARWPDVRVIMMSGLGSEGILDRAVEAGCIGVLSKVSSAAEIVAALRAAAL